MTNVQVENGYLMLANELWDALVKIRLSGEERQVFDFIIRKTWGYKKKEDIISLSQFGEATGGMKKPSVIRAIKNLLEKNMITKNGGSYGINKDYDKWTPLAKKLMPIVSKNAKSVSNIANTISKNANKSLAKLLPTKDIYKETITKENNTNVLEKSFGNQEINELHIYLKEKLGLEVLDKTVQINRNFANLCLKKFGFEKTKLAIDASSMSPFWRTKVTNFQSLYYNAVQIVQSIRGEVKSIDATKILHSQIGQGRSDLERGGIQAIEASISKRDKSSVV